jgi:hypothetical protein
MKCLEDDQSLEHKNLLTSMRTATDKETGKTLTVGELIINANAILYMTPCERRLTITQNSRCRYKRYIAHICTVSYRLNSESVE